jgi:acyl-homoserine lactone acylase PvdQ
MKHGGREYPLGGGSCSLPVPRACFTRVEVGRLRVVGGSSHHMVMEMSPKPSALSCFPLSASEDPESPQYTDITEIYAKKEFKPVWFTWDELPGMSNRIRHWTCQEKNKLHHHLSLG